MANRFLCSGVAVVATIGLGACSMAYEKDAVPPAGFGASFEGGIPLTAPGAVPPGPPIVGPADDTGGPSASDSALAPGYGAIYYGGVGEQKADGVK